MRPDAMTDLRRKNLAIYLGILLVALGVVMSATILERTILPAGTVVGTTRRAAALGVCRILLVASGVYFMMRRPRVTVMHLCAYVLVGFFSGVIGVIFLQLVYVPPRIVSGWRSFAPPAEQNELGFRG